VTIGVAPVLTGTGEDAPEPLIRKVATFGAVGVAATAVHLSIAWVLLGPLGGLAANAAGFVAGLGVTYLGNYFATFKSEAAHGPTLVRFLVVSAATLAASEWALIALHAMRADERVGLVIAIALLPLLRFGLLAKQVFVPAEAQTSLSAWLTDVGVWSGSVGIGLLALWAVAPAGFLDPTSSLWAGVTGEPESGLAGAWLDLADDWQSSLPAVAEEAADPGETATEPPRGIPLLGLATRAAGPLLGNDLNYLPAWFLLAFSAVGPAAVALLRQLAVRRLGALLAGAALAVAMPTLTFRTLHPALSAQFLLILVTLAALRVGRSEPGWSGPVVLGLALVTAAVIHPFLVALSVPVIGGIYILRLRAI